MTLESLFNKFDQFADAPDAVAKMRALVIRLAVGGKLVPNGPSEEPVGLAMSGTFDSTLQAPANWRFGIAGDVLSLEYGDNLPAPKRTESGEYPVYGSNGIVGTHNEYLTREPAIIVGRKGSAGALNISNGPSWTTDVAYFVRPPKDLDLRFTYYLLASLRLDELGKGIKPGLSRNEVYALPVALPPLGEQKRIVAKVDELMALCDRLEAQQEERETRRVALSSAAIARFNEVPTPANLNFLFHPSCSVTPSDLRKTILDLAIQGKLLPQDPKDESAESLLEHVEKQRNLIRAKAYPIVAPNEAPYDIPDSWSWTRLGNIALRSDSGWSPQCDNQPRSGAGWGILKVSAVSWGRFLPEENKALLPDLSARKECEVHDGDFLLSRANTEDLVARSVVIAHTPPHLMMSDKIVRFTFPDLIEKNFINLANSSSYARAYYSKNASGTSSSMKNVGRSVMCNLPIPVAPIAEQRRIVMKVNQLMGLVDQWEAQLATSEKTAKELLDAVVYELLHPTADIIEFPCSEFDRASQRAAIGCYAIEHLAPNPSFGRVMLMKVCYLSETHLGLPLGWRPMRQAAGPWDPWVQDFESFGTRSDWFAVTEKALNNGHSKIEYSPKKALKTKAAEAVSVLGSQKAEFDRLLNLFADKNTEEAEIITTLFAAWNDFLIDGKTPTDDEIIREVRENWHQSKGRFTPALLQRWLDWMRRQRLTPKGHGPRTRQQLTLVLS